MSRWRQSRDFLFFLFFLSVLVLVFCSALASGFGVGGCFWVVRLGDDGMAWWGISGHLGGFWGEIRCELPLARQSTAVARRGSAESCERERVH